MYRALNPGVVGVSAPTLEEAIRAAKLAGCTGVEVDPQEILRRSAETTSRILEDGGIRAAAWGLPGAWRGDEENYRLLIEDFPKLAEACAAIGCERVYTWILPASDDLDFDANWHWHIDRLKPLAQILADHGCKLGLEYVGPLTARASKPYEFVYNMKGMTMLAEEIGPNVGLMLDSWHWYTAGETNDQLKSLSKDLIVHVHVNDAPQGRSRDEQIDSQRELPGATGVIDIVSFLSSLKETGYDGPITPEPFNQALNGLPNDEARLAAVGESLQEIWDKAGL